MAAAADEVGFGGSLRFSGTPASAAAQSGLQPFGSNGRGELGGTSVSVDRSDGSAGGAGTSVTINGKDPNKKAKEDQPKTVLGTLESIEELLTSIRSHTRNLAGLEKASFSTSLGLSAASSLNVHGGTPPIAPTQVNFNPIETAAIQPQTSSVDQAVSRASGNQDVVAKLDQIYTGIIQLANSPRSLTFSTPTPVEDYVSYKNSETGSTLRGL